MKKFLLLVFAALSITSCASKSSVKNLNNNNSTESNNPITSEQNDDKYTIRFLNDEGTEISSKQYEFGETPEAPDTPSKENPLPQYTYTFSGWSPSIALVTEDVDYVATYKAEAKTGEVIWVDGDGETILTENYPYGSMPNYHGTIPTKTPTDTETYVFKGWSPEISLVASDSITYTAQFNSVPISTEYSIQINCTDCLVNKKKSINEKHAPLAELTYQFNNTSKETYHYPSKLDVTVDGAPSNDYVYDNITGKLNIKLTGNTVINAVADNSCVLMKYEYSADYPTVEITCDGNFEQIDWGDGTKDTNKSHTYSPESNVDQYDIRVFGKLNSVGTTSKAITSVNIFHSVTSIGPNAFKECTSLTYVTIPDSVTSIGDDAFHNCAALTDVIIPNSVTSIGNYAFCGCTTLNNIVIPSGVTSIGEYAFSDCDSFTNITIPSSITTISTGAFRYCSILTSVTIPNSVISIGNHAFGGCLKLASATIHNSVKSIGERAFYDCWVLANIVIPSSVTSIGYETFYKCDSAIIYCEVESQPGGWDDNWNRSDRPVYWNCLSFGSTSDFCYAVQQISDVKQIAISNYVGEPTTVEIPSEINVDGEDIPVTSIGDSAFYECPSITSATIPNSVTSIAKNAFYGSSSFNLLDLTDCDHVVTAGYHFIYNVDFYELQILVKASLVDQYRAAENWSTYANKIVGV